MNDAPHSTKPMMTIQESVVTCLRKYAFFHGRATRAEYWWWVLATWTVSAIAATIDSSISSLVGALTSLLSDGETISYFYSPLGSIFSFAILLPNLAVTCRRLHDINRTGWWQAAWLTTVFLGWIPFVIGIIRAFIGGLFGGDWEALAPLLIGLGISLLITLLVVLWVVLWMARQGQAGPNRFGPDPRALE